MSVLRCVEYCQQIRIRGGVQHQTARKFSFFKFKIIYYKFNVIYIRYAVIASACAACPKLECERTGCGTMFCYHCKSYWHPNQTCDQARDKSFMAALTMLNNEAPSTSKSSKGIFLVKWFFSVV